MMFDDVHVRAVLCLVLLVCFTHENHLANTRTQTSVSHPWPCGKMLYRRSRALKAWRITRLCRTSDSNHTRPRSPAPITLRVCYVVLMLRVYPVFIIMTPATCEGSADPACGLEDKYTELSFKRSWDKVHHCQGEEDDLQFFKSRGYAFTRSSSWLLSK